MAGKLEEDEAALRRYTRKVSVEQVALMAKKRENPTREIPKAKGGRKRAAVSRDSEDDKGEGSSKGKGRATKAGDGGECVGVRVVIVDDGLYWY